MQGDIVAVYNTTGTKLISYTYDAWGNFTTVYSNGGENTTAVKNPFRYRGYYYDEDLGLYYLQTRYYDSVTGRFISADKTDVLTATPNALTDKNLYAYCDNNPVMRVDPNGELWLTTLGIMAVGGLIGAAISAVSSMAVQQAFNGEINWASVGVAAVSGFVSGAVAASLLGLTGQMIAGGVIGGASYVADAWVNDAEISVTGLASSVVMGIASGWIGGKGANHNMCLTNTIDDVGNSIAREGRRANQAFAQKQISSLISYRNNTLSKAFWDAGSRFALGANFAGVVNNFFSTNKLFSNLPSWKPWG